MVQQDEIFVNEHNKPLVFTVSLGDHRQTIRELIEENGGHVAGSKEDKAIYMRLVPPTHEATEAGLYTTTYVVDCVEAGKLLPKDNYSVPIRGRRTNYRKKFTKQEDDALWEFMNRASADGHLAGNDIYKRFARENPSHPWQSWRDRAISKFLPNIRANRGTRGDAAAVVLSNQDDDESMPTVTEQLDDMTKTPRHPEQDDEDKGENHDDSDEDEDMRAANLSTVSETPIGHKRPLTDKDLMHSPHHKHTKDMHPELPQNIEDEEEVDDDEDDDDDGGDDVKAAFMLGASSLCKEFAGQYDRKQVAKALFMSSGDLYAARQILHAGFDINAIEEAHVRASVFTDDEDRLVQERDAGIAKRKGRDYVRMRRTFLGD